jgi:hypothetical protein
VRSFVNNSLHICKIQSSKWKFEFTGPNQILEFILKNWKMYWPEQSFTDLGPYVLILMTAQ